MSKTINLGRILPIFYGNWSSEKTYENLDVVYYPPDKASYVAIQTTRGEIPSNSQSWVLICQGGEPRNNSTAVQDGGTINSLNIVGNLSARKVLTSEIEYKGVSLETYLNQPRTSTNNFPYTFEIDNNNFPNY